MIEKILWNISKDSGKRSKNFPRNLNLNLFHEILLFLLTASAKIPRASGASHYLALLEIFQHCSHIY